MRWFETLAGSVKSVTVQSEITQSTISPLLLWQINTCRSTRSYVLPPAHQRSDYENRAYFGTLELCPAQKLWRDGGDVVQSSKGSVAARARGDAFCARRF